MAERVAEMTIDTTCGNGFRAEWTRFGLGPIDINNFRTSEQTITRSADMVRRTTEEVFALSYMQRGSALVNTNGMDIYVPEGGFILVSHANPYTMQFPEGAVAMTAHMRDSWLRRWVPQPETMVAKPMDASHWGSPLAAMLATIDRTGLGDAALPRSEIADQLGSFLSLMNGTATCSESLYKSDLLSRARRIMRDRLEDLEFNPMALARELGMSKRYVHKLFASDRTTFGVELSEIRLNRAAQMLRDPRYVTYRVADIAYACGFSDPSHFARRFRDRFAATPLAYRKSS
jgi:AraC-like DNA-binding protein